MLFLLVLPYFCLVYNYLLLFCNFEIFGRCIGGSALKVTHFQKFQNYEMLRGRCIPSKNKFETQKQQVKVARY